MIYDIPETGIGLYYELQGSGPPLVLLHGNGEDHTIFDEIVPLLAKDYAVYALDSRGHGQSTPVEAYDYGDMAGDVIAFVRGLKLEKPALYGFSDGGIVGLLVASREPDLLSKLIVSGANTDPEGFLWFLRFGITVQNLFQPNPLLQLMLQQPHISAGDLGKISVPTLVTAGEKDIFKRAHTEAIAAAVPNSALVILKGETHDSYVVHSEKLYGVLAPFLKDERGNETCSNPYS